MPISSFTCHLAPILTIVPLLWGAGVHAHTVAPAGLVDSFASLSTMRPRVCAGARTGASIPGWTALPAQCAWQGLLRHERWRLAPGKSSPANACVSPAALWWAGARQRHANRPPGAWQGEWTAQIMRDERGPVKRLALIRQDAAGAWSASEWTWRPSERAATRVWQQARWAALAAEAGQLAQASRIAAGAPVAPLFTLWERHLGQQSGEIRGGIGYWLLGPRCMVLDLVGIADSRFQLPYLLDDSRLEQRSAMQLQLARRYPKATWLRSFRAVPDDPDAPHGRASYIAVWRDELWLRGQLWLPTKGEGPVLRMRVGTGVPAARGEAQEKLLEDGARLIETELGALARRWRTTHD